MKLTIEEKCLIAIEKGCTVIDGKTYASTGNQVTYTDKQGNLQLNFRVDGKPVMLRANQFAWYLKHKEPIRNFIHKNGDKTDLNISNLEPCKQADISIKSKAKRNVWFCKTRNKWLVRFYHDYTTVYLGCFETEIEANECYDDFYGLFAFNTMLRVECYDFNESEFIKKIKEILLMNDLKFFFLAKNYANLPNDLAGINFNKLINAPIHELDYKAIRNIGTYLILRNYFLNKNLVD